MAVKVCICDIILSLSLSYYRFLYMYTIEITLIYTWSLIICGNSPPIIRINFRLQTFCVRNFRVTIFTFISMRAIYLPYIVILVKNFT